MTITTDARRALAALDRLGVLAAREAQEVAEETGLRIQHEARARFNRQTSGSGQTAKNITVEETAAGVRVYVKAIRRPANMPIWFDFGTVHMLPRPFFFSSAQLEEAPHRRRMLAALERAAAEASR